MVNFNKEENPNKITLQSKVTFGARSTGPEIEANPVLTREVIEEEKAFRRGVLSVRDIIAPASLRIDANYLHLVSF